MGQNLKFLDKNFFFSNCRIFSVSVYAPRVDDFLYISNLILILNFLQNMRQKNQKGQIFMN
jgi:hypothetical protein